MRKGQAPDFKNGYAIVYGNENHWRTEVRSILLKKETGDAAYLTHECRAEGVNEENIFDGRLYEFVAIKTWLGNYMIRSGSYNYGYGETQPNTTYEYYDNREININCPQREVSEYSFVDIFEKIRNGFDDRIFMKIDFIYNNTEYTLYCPSRYINYPDKKSNKKYLQPISGYNLFYNGEIFVLSYMAAHLTDDKCHIEFITREPIAFIHTKVKNGKIRKLFSPFDFITKKLLRTDEFWKTYKVDGCVTFYTYKT